ncbi:MAG: DNA polymerase III subunit delta [Tannerella sp.]|jgi:DNA polymerase-3 subunit delta|nr:DNA polymerase III subunit delta [Tannerella sp.]
MAKKTHTYEDICNDIRARKFAPVYFLMGEEPYFIDKITDLLLETVLSEDERDYNQFIFYGADSTTIDVFNAVRRCPMMSEYQLVVVREAQSINSRGAKSDDDDESGSSKSQKKGDLELLANYVENPLKTTILVVNYKYGAIDRRRKLAVAVEKNGILFESKKIPDYELNKYIASVLKQRSIEADTKVIAMLGEYLGSDLALLDKELEKLLILISGQPVKRITPEIVEKYIGISKDFNNFELKSAIAAKDVLKANRIIKHFGKNPKNHPIQGILPVLFDYFSNLMICHYSKDRSERALMSLLNFYTPIQIRDYMTGLRKYSPMKVYEIIHEIRMADARSKGIEATSSLTDDENMKELLYKILH